MSEPKRCSLKRIAFIDIADDLPKFRPFSLLERERIRLLIVAKGFEERVLVIPRLLALSHAIGPWTTVLVGNYLTNTEDNERRYCELRAIVEGVGAGIVHFDADDPRDTVNAVSNSLSRLVAEGDECSAFFDMSGSSSPLILSVLFALFQSASVLHVTVVYSEAAAFYPDAGGTSGEACRTLDAIRKAPREEGVQEAKIHEYFPGLRNENRPSHVIGVPNLNPERFTSCLSFLSDETGVKPDEALTILLPYSEAPDHAWRSEAIDTLARQLFASSQEEDQELKRPMTRFCDAREYYQTLSAIVELADLHIGKNMHLVHMGVKMQSVGAAIALMARSEISAIYARPRRFNADSYSSGVGSIWRVDFSDPAGLIRKVRGVGSLQVTWDEADPRTPNRSTSS